MHRSTDIPAAVAAADVVVLAVPYGAVADVAARIAQQVRGKVVVDASNPLTPDFSALAVSERSGAEEIKELLAGAHIVKALNTVFAANQATGSIDGIQLDGFYAGDDEQAKTTVAELLTAMGFRPVDAGPLKAAQALEHMAFLNISLNANGWSWRSGWKLIGPLVGRPRRGPVHLPGARRSPASPRPRHPGRLSASRWTTRRRSLGEPASASKPAPASSSRPSAGSPGRAHCRHARLDVHAHLRGGPIVTGAAAS